VNALLAGLVPGTAGALTGPEDPGALTGDSVLAAPAKPTIGKLRYEHRAMARLLAANPLLDQGDLAEIFDYSPSWISTILCSDMFQSLLAEEMEKSEFGSEFRGNAKLQLAGLLERSMEVLRKKLDKAPEQIPDQLALQTARMAAGALDMGPKRASIHETHIHLETLGENLVSLLRRKKEEAYHEAPPAIEGTCEPSQTSGP
jgi:hypothetical protein